MPTQALVAVGGRITAATTNTTITNANTAGSTGIIPTSVAGSGVAVGTNGVVTLTAATSASINGCFTSTYDWYTIEFDITTSGASALNIVLRAAGTDSTAANYDSQRFTASNATGTAAQTLAAASWPLTTSGIASRQTGTLKLYGPAIAAATAGTIFAGETPNPMTTSAVLYNALLQHRLTSSFDGFTISGTTGTLSGTVRIYGQNNN